MSYARAARVIRAGGIVAYATEAVFGLGCDPRRRASVLRLLRLKRRPARKGLILIAATPAQLAPFVADLPACARESWPGPYTWLVPRSKRAPFWLTGRHPRIAVRVTAHAGAARLCRCARTALVSTSANVSRARPVRSYREAHRRFGKGVDYVVPGRVGRQKKPTAIRDSVTGAQVRSA